jgi:hypothetical protein
METVSANGRQPAGKAQGSSELHSFVLAAAALAYRAKHPPVPRGMAR